MSSCRVCSREGGGGKLSKGELREDPKDRKNSEDPGMITMQQLYINNVCSNSGKANVIITIDLNV